jgi:gamma-glutamylcyclotransferase (GGCT)/AIG2-like uncharacterized protein YtfP
MATEIQLFVCDTLLSGEPDHTLLERARPLGAAKTRVGYSLVDLGATGALLNGGLLSVTGELYSLTPQDLAVIDVRRGHPLVHERRLVQLEGGLEVEAYFISEDQARGRRRIRTASWKTRHSVSPCVEPSPLVSWARRRFNR